MYGMKLSVVVMVLAAVARESEAAVFGVGNIMPGRYPKNPEFHTMEVPEMATATPGVANLPGTVVSRTGSRPVSTNATRPVDTAQGPISYPVGPISSRPVNKAVYFHLGSYGPRHPVPILVRGKPVSSRGYPQRSGYSSNGRSH
ncbi:uncharacterized protein LOC121874994 [Homarus americanus]|uniref:Secreted protein n=1 Tax=Homarus americanus TaxID=6706 RepID=A0A8J5NC33_HOMAM|nr:uncharacterized protein LOC121874994 [Homarus americanus]KAG7176488.1 hypothetical protein Hamer_G023341 [Homarus americanus]